VPSPLPKSHRQCAREKYRLWIERDVTPLAKEEVQRTLQAMGREELFAANAQRDDVEMAQHCWQ